MAPSFHHSHLEVDGVDQNQDGVGVQCARGQNVPDLVLSLVGHSVVDGDPGVFWVLLQHMAHSFSSTDLCRSLTTTV